MLERFSVDHSLSIVRQGLLDVGYLDKFIIDNYTFSDSIGSRPHTRQIELAAFGQKPFSTRSACFGATIVSDRNPQTIGKFQSLGAPQVLALNPDAGEVGFWKIAAKGDPTLTTTISLNNLREVLVNHQSEVNPYSVLRAKAVGLWQPPAQQGLFEFDPDLVPEIEARLGKRLDSLLCKVIAESKEVYQERHSEEFPFIEIARLLFRFIAAKLLIDRQHPVATEWKGYDGSTVVKAVDSFYFGEPQSTWADDAIQNAAWEKMRGGFSVQNWSVEVFAYVYENTLVSEELRKKAGVHATPTAIAEYLVRQLPFEDLDLQNCRVFEPFSGHAPFLVAALSRLRLLLPMDMEDEDRHEYFKRALSGMEAEPFAQEVGLRSLMIADYPNKDHWDIQLGDIYTSPKFEDYAKRANVVLCNPPYEKFDVDYRESHSISRFRKGAEALLKVLDSAPQMLGFVLPRSFLSGQDYDAARRKVDEIYNTVEIVSLPDNTFAHSNVEPILLIAHSVKNPPRVRWSTQVDKSDYKRFLRTYQPSWKVRNPAATGAGLAWYTPLQRVWNALSHLPTLKVIADTHRGIEYNINVEENESLLFSPVPKPGFEKGAWNVRPSGLEPYIIKNHLYLNMDRALIRRAFDLPWNEPKVIANAARIKGDRWVLAATVDSDLLRCSQRFHCIWPKGDTALEVIAAILNGPVANAYISTRRKWGDLEVGVVADVPVPKLSASQVESITSLVWGYHSIRQQWLNYQGPLLSEPEANINFESMSKEVTWQIDAEILAAYNLPISLECELLDYFEGYGRPGPLGFELSTLLRSLPAWITGNRHDSGSKLVLERYRKDEAANEILEAWLREPDAGEGGSWEELKKAINEDRLSYRKFINE